MSAIIDKLNDEKEALVSYVFRAQASTPEQEDQLHIVLMKANALEGLVNALTLQDVTIASMSLVGQANALDALATRIKAEAKTIADVAEVIDIAAQIIGIAAQIAMLVAAV